MITGVSNVMNTYTQQNVSKNNNQYNKEMFLDLMVAQMKYQNPLEPKSEMDSISQYAAFTQVEQLQNMVSEFQKTNAINMVGKVVEISSIDEAGNAIKVHGKVEDVDLTGERARLYVNNEYHEYEEIERVIDEKV